MGGAGKPPIISRRNQFSTSVTGKTRISVGLNGRLRSRLCSSYGAGVQADCSGSGDVERLLPARLADAHRQLRPRRHRLAYALAFMAQRPSARPRQILVLHQRALV